jgi:hypothetical protein
LFLQIVLHMKARKQKQESLELLFLHKVLHELTVEAKGKSRTFVFTDSFTHEG